MAIEERDRLDKLQKRLAGRELKVEQLVEEAAKEGEITQKAAEVLIATFRGKMASVMLKALDAVIRRNENIAKKASRNSLPTKETLGDPSPPPEDTVTGDS